MTNKVKTKDKLLFTPGPLTTSLSVKEATLTDLGSRDSAFISIIHDVRNKLLTLGHVSKPDYESIIIQGSGTFGIESVISSAIPADGMLLNIINGAYGRRISQMARIHNIPLIELIYDEDTLPNIEEIKNLINDNGLITHVSVIHGETTTGMINPIGEIGEICSNNSITMIVDAMSTYGAYDINLKELNISYLISSSNKCIEGIPGFSFVLAKRNELDKCKGLARTLSLDLYDQWNSLNSSGQFRFTPPVQALLAFNKALEELDTEGGIEARARRYSENNLFLINEMTRLGFKIYLPESVRGYIITSFVYPVDPAFSFQEFYNKLNEKGFVIYPGKLSKTDCFRIGNIGQLFLPDMKRLTETIGEIMGEMKIDLTK